MSVRVWVRRNTLLAGSVHGVVVQMAAYTFSFSETRCFNFPIVQRRPENSSTQIDERKFGIDRKTLVIITVFQFRFGKCCTRTWTPIHRSYLSIYHSFISTDIQLGVTFLNHFEKHFQLSNLILQIYALNISSHKGELPIVRQLFSQSPITAQLLNSSICCNTVFSANFLAWLRMSVSRESRCFDFRANSWTFISIGKPWQSHPGTYETLRFWRTLYRKMISLRILLSACPKIRKVNRIAHPNAIRRSHMAARHEESMDHQIDFQTRISCCYGVDRVPAIDSIRWRICSGLRRGPSAMRLWALFWGV